MQEEIEDIESDEQELIQSIRTSGNHRHLSTTFYIFLIFLFFLIKIPKSLKNQ